MEKPESNKGVPPLVVIVGPTGIGKTKLSLKLAAQKGGEIVSADSRLFYRGMEIGTDKPSLTDRHLVRHHLIDICEPDETISLGLYKKLAVKAVDQIYDQNSIPFLVGGTGQYIMAVVEGWQIPEVAPDKRLRSDLDRLSEDELGQWLQLVDPISAGRIDFRNKRRVIRALEVTLKTGVPFSKFQEKIKPDYNIFMIGLTAERETIYDWVDSRVERMMSAGLLDEVIGLLEQGFDRKLPSLSGLGYQQLITYLDGECSLSEAVASIKFDTHRFIRQQSNWFRPDDRRINWFDVQELGYPESAGEHLSRWLQSLKIVPQK